MFAMLSMLRLVLVRSKVKWVSIQNVYDFRSSKKVAQFFETSSSTAPPQNEIGLTAARYHPHSEGCGNPRYNRKSQKQTKNVALHSDFQEKVNRWKELLKNEVASDVREIRDLLQNPSVDELEKLGQVSGALRFQMQYLHALHGHVIVLHQIKGVEQKVTRKTFHPGTPVSLCRIPELASVSDCIVISCSGNQISLKTKGKKVNIGSSDEFVLVPSVGLGYLLALDEFLNCMRSNVIIADYIAH
uniref:POP4 domain-containing protein n=1 Tax=Elaeophora elaphi TaxID=1147741 RepID=A0A0R3RYS9_9BILA